MTRETLLGALASTVWILAAGIVVGAVVLGGAWRIAVRRAAKEDPRLDGARVLARAAPVAALVAAALLLARGVFSMSWPLEPVTLLVPGLFTAAAAAVGSGCWLVIVAGRREARGSVDAAARLVRLGGKTMFLGTVAWLVLFAVALFRLPGGTRHVLLEQAMFSVYGLLLGAIALGLAGFVGLLAGLSGKPRPSGPLAALLYLLALGLIVVGAETARRRTAAATDAPARLSIPRSAVEPP